MKRLLPVFLVLASLLAGCAAIGPGGPTPTPTTPPPEFKIEILTLGENPRPAGGMAIALGATPNVDAPNTNITITVPAGATVLTGSKAWSGDLKANQGIFLNLMIEIPALTAPAEIKFEAVSYPNGKNKLSGAASLYLRPAADGKIEYSKTPFK